MSTSLLFLNRLFLYLKFSFFFFNDTATTEIYTLSLHDALPISLAHDVNGLHTYQEASWFLPKVAGYAKSMARTRSEEHTSELQSHLNLVCRLLLEKKKNSKLK